MNIYYTDKRTTVYHGDCLDVLASMPDNSVDSIVTDPPYGLSNTKPAQVADVLKAWVTGDTEAVPAKRGGFMGKDWDSFVPPPAVWEECMRVLKPGGHMAVFAGARTQDLMGLSIRLAGFEIRDSLAWLYGSGFPKSQNIARQLDKTLGEDVPIGKSFNTAGGGDRESEFANNGRSNAHEQWSPMSDAAKQWDGWGTALKPAIEPIILARKPLVGTVVNNVLEHGTGGINIDATRIESDDLEALQKNWDRTQSSNQGIASTGLAPIDLSDRKPSGRWPANVLLDEHAASWVDEQSGISVSRRAVLTSTPGAIYGGGAGLPSHTGEYGHNDSGGASRFFPVFKYNAKAPKSERPIIEREDGTKIQHPTVKPLALMEWLIRLITPPGGTVLDPFAGSGTTIEAAITEGFNPVGIEMEADYLRLIDVRIARAKETLDLGGTETNQGEEE